VHNYSREEYNIVLLRERLGIPDDVQPDPIDVLRRATYVGIIAGFCRVSDDELGTNLARWDKASKQILFRENHSPTEFAFTIFHELGHAVLNHGSRNRKVGGALQFGRYAERDEEEADRFARSFMAPIKLAIVDQNSTTDLLARFGLPESQRGIRLEELKRIDRQQRGLTRQIPMVEPEVEEDTYELAMNAMRQNAINWNS